MRESGYYFIKLKEDDAYDIAKYNGVYWDLYEYDDIVRDNDIFEIGDKVDIPEKYRN